MLYWVSCIKRIWLSKQRLAILFLCDFFTKDFGDGVILEVHQLGTYAECLSRTRDGDKGRQGQKQSRVEVGLAASTYATLEMIDLDRLCRVRAI